ncbi:MAG: hypothetical protein FWG68_08585 [Defluviitaleaceae bacterium]|nr:hypothetical protein [Defluviitaleaceae bacterium]
MSTKAEKIEKLTNEYKQSVYDNHMKKHGVPPEMPIVLSPFISGMIEIWAEDDDPPPEPLPKVSASEIEQELRQYIQNLHIEEHGEPPKTPITIAPLVSDLISILANDTSDKLCISAFARSTIRCTEGLWLTD